MWHRLLMISSEAPGGETAVEPARTPIRKPASPAGCPGSRRSQRAASAPRTATVIPAAGGAAAGAPRLTTRTLQIEPDGPALDGDELVISAPDGTAKIDAMPEGQPATSAQQEGRA